MKNEFDDIKGIKAKIYMHFDTYIWFRQQIFQRIDKHLYELVEHEDWDLLIKGLDEIEQVLIHLESMDKNFGIDDEVTDSDSN